MTDLFYFFQILYYIIEVFNHTLVYVQLATTVFKYIYEYMNSGAVSIIFHTGSFLLTLAYTRSNSGIVGAFTNIENSPTQIRVAKAGTTIM